MSAMLFETVTLDPIEEDVIARIDDARARLKYALATTRRWTGLLARATLARSIQGSNSIEGYNVSVEDAIAAVEGGDPLDAPAEVWTAIKGYREAMTYILQLADDPHFVYHEALIRSLHFMMLSYDHTKRPGQWRPGAIFVRRDATGEVVYEGPDPELVPGLMGELVGRLNEKNSAHAMVRAAMGHLDLVMIHPFSDGNGRMARALQTLVLVREGVLNKEFCSIEEYLGQFRQEYYDSLGEVGGGRWRPERDARPFVRFCLRAHYRQAQRLLVQTKIVARLWEEAEQEIDRRGLPDRVIAAIVDAAMGFRVRNATYRPAAGITEHLASRDLKLLVDAGLLVAEGERRGRSYRAGAPIVAIRDRVGELFPPQPPDDPFELAEKNQT